MDYLGILSLDYFLGIKSLALTYYKTAGGLSYFWDFCCGWAAKIAGTACGMGSLLLKGCDWIWLLSTIWLD